MTHLQFARPQWLWIGALCCVAALGLLARAGRLRRRAAGVLAGGRFVSTVSRARRLVKQTLVLVGLAATFVALARPLLGFRWEEERRDGVDLMFAVDTSKSMLATDLRPDRLTRAKLAVSDLLRKFPGERVGLIAFAGEAFVQAPMTIDQAVFEEALDALDTSVIPRGGTDLASPIRAAIEAMATEPDRRKILVVLSDGEDLQGEALAAAQEAARAGLVIYTVGVGTPSGDLIPIERDGRREILRDADGHPVISRLDARILRRLAEVTGGAYVPLGASGQGLERLYRQHLAGLPRRTVEERMHKVYTERFQIPLAVAIGCLMLELGLGERRRGSAVGAGHAARGAPPIPAAARSGRPIGSAAKGAMAAMVLLMAGAARPALAAPARTSAGAAATATGASTYNDGTAAYRKKDFAAARDRFQDATHTTDLSVQEDAYYDLGNARYRLGQASLSKDRPATIEAWKGAVASYDGALALYPQDGDARFNRDLVARRLAAVQEQDRRDQPQKDQQQPNNPHHRQDPKQGQGQQPQASSGQPDRQKRQGAPQSQPNGQGSPQSGGGQPQPAQGTASPRDSNGKQPSSAPGSPQNGQPEPQRSTRAGQDRAGLEPEHDRGTRPGSSPQAQQPAALPSGPGVVSGQPDRATGQAQPAAARRDPGGLTTGEAVELLDSVQGELHRLPVADARRRQPIDDNAAPIKDW